MPVVTWERIRHTYRDVAPHYFDAMLAAALELYPSLVYTPVRNQDGILPGAVLVSRFLGGDHTCAWMGRNGGLTGAVLADDIATGRWRTTGYQFSTRPVYNYKWFAVADFIERFDLGRDDEAQL